MISEIDMEIAKLKFISYAGIEVMIIVIVTDGHTVQLK